MASILAEQASTLVSRLIEHLRIPLFRNAYALASSSILTSGIGMVYWVLAARTYPANLVGLNSAIISVMMFLGGIAQLNLADGAIRFVPNAGKQTGRFVQIISLISLALAALGSLIFLSQIGHWAPTLAFLGAGPALAIWFTLSTMGWAIFALQDGILTGLRRAPWVLVKNTAYSLVKVILMLIFVTSLPQLGLYASWSVGLAIIVLPTIIIIFRSLLPQHMRQEPQILEPLALRPVARYVAGDYAGALAWLACISLLPIMVLQIVGPTANAYYYLSWQISLLLIAISGNMGSSLVVEATLHPENLREYSYRVMVQAALIVGPAAAVLILIAPYVLLLFGQAYSTEATALLRLLALSTVAYIPTIVYVSMAQVRRRISRIILALGSLCVLVLSLSALLLPRFGILGAGYAWLAGQVLVAGGIFIAWARGADGPRRAK
jgi:O-antigen/teichoic acid export membrane protein